MGTINKITQIIYMAALLVILLVVLSGCNRTEYRQESNQDPNAEENVQESSQNPCIEEDVSEQFELRQLSDRLFAGYDKKDYEDVFLIKTHRVDYLDDYLENFKSQRIDLTENDVNVGRNDITGSEVAACWFYTQNGFKYDDAVLCMKLNKGMSFFDTEAKLSCATEEAVEEDIKQALEGFGIEECNCYVYPVSREMFVEISEFYDAYYGPYEDGDTAASLFGTYSEFYYAQVKPTVDGIEIYDGLTGDIDKGTMTFGTEIYVIYTVNGIEALFMANVYETFDTEKEHIEILRAVDAEKLLIEKYNNMIDYEETVMTEMKIVYIPIPSEFFDTGATAEYYTMTPAWCFSDADGNYILFDAVTGKEIL